MLLGNEAGLKREQIFVSDEVSAAEGLSWGHGSGQSWDNEEAEKLSTKKSPKAELDAILFIDSMVTYNIHTTSQRYLEGIVLSPWPGGLREQLPLRQLWA